MVDEADVRQDGNIDYKCLCSQFTLTSSIIRLFFQGSANIWLEKKSTGRARKDKTILITLMLNIDKNKETRPTVLQCQAPLSTRL